MTIATRLDAALGKNINKICENKFHDPAANHCAHFVSHICDLTFSFNCKQFAGGNKPGANVRIAPSLVAEVPNAGVSYNRVQICMDPVTDKVLGSWVDNVATSRLSTLTPDATAAACAGRPGEGKAGQH